MAKEALTNNMLRASPFLLKVVIPMKYADVIAAGDEVRGNEATRGA